jgi:hypothetical protein
MGQISGEFLQQSASTYQFNYLKYKANPLLN